MLGLEDRLQISAFHPRDTFQILTAEDGTRQWDTTLPYPIIHLVRKQGPPRSTSGMA